MPMELILGVVDVPYKDDPNATTGSVADILEAHYGLFQAFYNLYEQQIITLLFEAVQKGMEGPQMGPMTSHVFDRSMDKIKKLFVNFLDSQEVERVGIEGVPTQAALRGVSHRLKHPYAKDNPRRPSFIDTGLLEQSFKAWIEGA